jgi:hypothetical protein
MEFNLTESAAFFQFFDDCEVKWWFVEGQPRLKTGKNIGRRGAPIGAHFGFKFAVPAHRATAGFQKLCDSLLRKRKQSVDLQTRESPDRSDGARVILIDDLTDLESEKLMGWWRGPVWLMETSPKNYQALIVSPFGLDSATLSNYQRCLAIKFHGDLGAVGAGQLHRFPGSPNFKTQVLVDGMPFICKTVGFRHSIDVEAGSEQMKELLQNKDTHTRALHASAAASNKKKKQLAKETEEPNNSVLAWRWTVQNLRKGRSHQAILDGLRDRFLSRHDPTDWPGRTLHNALFWQGQVKAKYSKKLHQHLYEFSPR